MPGAPLSPARRRQPWVGRAWVPADLPAAAPPVVTAHARPHPPSMLVGRAWVGPPVTQSHLPVEPLPKRPIVAQARKQHAARRSGSAQVLPLTYPVTVKPVPLTAKVARDTSVRSRR